MPLIGTILKKVFGTKQDRDMRRYAPYVEAVNSLEEWTSGLSDGELRLQTDIFRQRLQDGEELIDLLPEAFAVANYGTLVPPDDVEALAAALRHWAAVPPLPPAQRRRLWERVDRDFSLGASAARIKQCYEDLLRSRQALPCKRL